MMLCLDCGNTRIKWGLLNGDGDWHARGALALADVGQLSAQLASHPHASTIHACNVAGPDIAAAIESQLGSEVRWARSELEQGGVRNSYTRIAQLGVDRWVSLVAARGLHAGPCLVVNAGTATTIDLLDADGVFQGGLIVPGLTLMRQSLARNTAQLPDAAAAYAELPRDTDAAIVAGTLEATLGAIERMYARLAARDDGQSPLCLLGGGAAEALLPLLRIPVKNVDDLVLRGLARIAQSHISAA